MKSSDVSQTSKSLIAVSSLLSLIAVYAVWWVYGYGYTLYYGDAQAHLNISRSLIDSQNPGYLQIGTVWLPLLHVLCLPFAGNMFLWSSGLAGAIPVACCFIIAATALYAAAFRIYSQKAAALTVVGCFALNPNVLYLASIPMTELVFIGGLAVELLAIVRFQQTQHTSNLIVGILASWAMCLTRYDGWFLIPFITLLFARAARRSRLRVLLVVGLACSVAPLYWLAHCWWSTGNALDFFNGPYSAKAIQGNKPYPGLHNWAEALHYYFAAGRDCSGWPLVLLGIVGCFVAIAKHRTLGIVFLCLTPAFYIWSIHSSGTPIFVPELYPHGLYNTRYGIAVVVLFAFACGALAGRSRLRAALLVLVAVSPWLLHPSHENWICWKESERNSLDRRAWTAETAKFLIQNRGPEEIVLAPFGDLTGIFCRARIPLRQVLHEGDDVAWMANSLRPDLVHQSAWAVLTDESPLASRLARSGHYTLAAQIHAGQSKPIDIFKRNP